jgi:beta-phosphoglucomutase-like phosphatase (HAD superfamily)
VPAAAALVVEDSVSRMRAAKAAGARCPALTATFPAEVLAAGSPDWLALAGSHFYWLHSATGCVRVMYG